MRVRGESVKSHESSIDCAVKCVHMQSIFNKFSDNDNNNNEYERVKPIHCNDNMIENECNNSEHLVSYMVDNRNNSEQNHNIMTSSAQMAAKCTTTTTSCTTSATNTTNATTIITKNERFKHSIQQSVSDKTKKRITSLIGEIEQFNDIEKLLLYMQLPYGASQDADPLKQKGPGNPFGKKADIEVAQTYTWIQSHLEEDSSVSLPKQEVYEEYKAFCDINKFEPLCVADFGKAMKHVFPRVKPRRLGQRGNSKYCYSGLRKKLNIEPPELPLIDTSSYDLYKSNCNKNSDDSEIHSDESLEKTTLSHESITSAATTLILEWADKLLNCSSESLIDLAEYLVKSGLVDIKSVAALTLKSTVQQTKSHSKSANSRRRDVQNQLQKKLQEKEQKKKMEQAINAKILKKNRKNKTDDCEFAAVTCQQNNMITVKKEPDIEISQFQANQAKYIQPNRIQANKVAIPRSGTCTPSRLTQPISSTTSIILVPTAAVRLASPQTSLTTESQATTTTMSAMCSASPLKSAASKYKKIQPKPVNICRSDSESAVSVLNAFDGCIADALNGTVKRRHSLSAPLTLSTSIKLKNDTYTEKQLQVKRQIEERDYSALTSSKKRHVDSTDNFMLSNNTNTNSSGFDDQNSSNSLSPISQESQPFSNNVVLKRTSDIKIQDLENEALDEYFSPTNSNKDQWDINGNGIHVVNSQNNNNGNNNTNNNNSADLSQLRQLLQNVIPNNVNVQQKRVESMEACSELREALLRKNLNNSVQTFESFKTNDKNGDNGSVTLSLKENVELGKSRQIDGLVTSPVMEKIHCISNNPLIGMNSLTNTNSLFTECSTISHNVQIQVPSVPPSPNARRRAFNFLPISPRNTPTIPENASIDLNGYNNSIYTTAINSPPQYRVNQQTVGVGPSQPSSEANSPFVSPRSTPIPLCRSRHNSGQSNYSALRQTPLQSFDSGVSSISSSPFISPQSTPVPISRNRTVSMQRFARARHSSGPGGPCNINQVTACHRSNSLSPMIGDHFMRDGTTLAQPLIFNNELHSQINSPVLSNSNGTTSLTPVTPVSPLSPSNMLQQSEINSINTDLIGSSNEFLLNGDNEVLQSSEWQPQTNAKLKSSLTHSLVNRHRHSSNPYTGPSTSISHNNLDSFSNEYSNEIFSFMKNCTNESESTLCSALSQKSVGNRCQSVPMHQMIQSNNMKNVLQLSISSAATKSENEAIMQNEMANVSKSYPATPICNQNFHFPPSPPSSTKLQSVIGGDDIISGNVLQSGQDVMVSGIQLAENAIWNSNIGNTQQTDDLISITVNGINSSANVRRNLNALLAEPPDDLDTTLEDLRDCDNDFSKFAQELEASCYDDLS